MMSTVTSMLVDKALILRLFSKFRSRYGQLWTSRVERAEDWDFVLEDWLEELSKFPLNVAKQAFNEALTIHREYPPTLGQIIELCLKEEGLPDIGTVIRKLVAKEFDHPLIKIIYDKIGSWKLSNGTEKEIAHKVSEYYAGTVAEFKLNKKECWAQLESFNAKSKELPIPDKIPTNAERKSFKERMEEYYKLQAQIKAGLKPLDISVFDKKKINTGGEQYDDYCKYLLSVPEKDVLGLSPAYAYDRQRLINRGHTAKHLRDSGFVPDSQREYAHKAAHTSKPTHIYKAWMDK